MRPSAPPTPETLVANYGARTTQAFGEISAPFGPLRPFAGVDFVNVATDGFTESGGSGALSVAGSSRSVTFTTLGLRASAPVGNMTAHGSVGWRHAFGAIAAASDMTIQGNPFAVAGVPVAASAAVIGAGIDFAVSERFRLGLSYAGTVSTDVQQHGARATANLKF